VTIVVACTGSVSINCCWLRLQREFILPFSAITWYYLFCSYSVLILVFYIIILCYVDCFVQMPTWYVVVVLIWIYGDGLLRYLFIVIWWPHCYCWYPVLLMEHSCWYTDGGSINWRCSLLIGIVVVDYYIYDNYYWWCNVVALLYCCYIVVDVVMLFIDIVVDVVRYDCWWYFDGIDGITIDDTFVYYIVVVLIFLLLLIDDVLNTWYLLVAMCIESDEMMCVIYYFCWWYW